MRETIRAALKKTEKQKTKKQQQKKTKTGKNLKREQDMSFLFSPSLYTHRLGRMIKLMYLMKMMSTLKASSAEYESGRTIDMIKYLWAGSLNNHFNQMNIGMLIAPERFRV